MNQQQLVEKINDARTRWLQLENQTINSKNIYYKNLETTYLVLQELQLYQNDLLVAIVNSSSSNSNTPQDPASQQAPTPASVPPPTPLPIKPANVETKLEVINE